jgi:hypothetical protein
VIQARTRRSMDQAPTTLAAEVIVGRGRGTVARPAKPANSPRIAAPPGTQARPPAGSSATGSMSAA